MTQFAVARDKYYVLDLRPEDVLLTENGVEQKIAFFEAPDLAADRKLPVDVYLLMDVSLSVANRDLITPYILEETVIKGLGGRAYVIPYAFARRTVRLSEPTNDTAVLEKAFERLPQLAHGGSLIYEAVARVCEDMSKAAANRRRILVILSDGRATGKGKPELAIQAARRVGVAIYPVILGHTLRQERMSMGPVNPRQMPRNASPKALEAQMDIEEFSELGRETGGRSFDPERSDPVMLRAILRYVAEQVAVQYTIGHYGGAERKAGRTRIEVKLRNAKAGKLRGGVRTLVN